MNVSEKQGGGFRKGKGCGDQIFPLGWYVVEKYKKKKKEKNYTLPSWIWKKLMTEFIGWHGGKS